MPPSSTAFPPHIRQIVQELRARLEDLYEDRLHDVVLYGSHAREEATDASDVDIMVVLEGEVDAWAELQRMAEPVYDLELETGELISLYPIARTAFEHRDLALLTNVRREGVRV